MLNGFTPLAHPLRMLVEPPLNVLKNVFMLPAGNSALLACAALILAYPVITHTHYM